MVFYLTGLGHCLSVAKQLEETSIWHCYLTKFPMATPLQKQDGGLCYVLRDTLGESAWDSGIYKRAGRFLMSSQSAPSISGILRWNGKLEPQSRRSRRTEPTTVTCGGR